MKKALKTIIIIGIFLLIVFTFSGCNTNKKNIVNEKNKTITHLRDIPVELHFNNYLYTVYPKAINNVDNEIGTIDDGNFRVFKLKDTNIDKEIALLVREADPKIFFKAVKK